MCYLYTVDLRDITQELEQQLLFKLWIIESRDNN